MRVGRGGAKSREGWGDDRTDENGLGMGVDGCAKISFGKGGESSHKKGK